SRPAPSREGRWRAVTADGVESVGRSNHVSSAKQLVREVLDSLPDDCTVDDVQYELYVRQRIGEGEEAARAGKVVPHSQVMREAREWLRRL
ncbi:MAG TPA: hypothetical protein VMT87_16070, partial [Vicinamibacteria bacterium]|nr:hypothetical protein [Vicinamibacteria bacterium]